MKNNYRINVRFDLRKEREKEAAEYLTKLSEQSSGTRNRFIVDGVIEAIRRQQAERTSHSPTSALCYGKNYSPYHS